MPTCYQTTATTAAAAAAMMKKIANASWLLCGKKKEKCHSAINIVEKKRRPGDSPRRQRAPLCRPACGPWWWRGVRGAWRAVCGPDPAYWCQESPGLRDAALPRREWVQGLTLPWCLRWRPAADKHKTQNTKHAHVWECGLIRARRRQYLWAKMANVLARSSSCSDFLFKLWRNGKKKAWRCYRSHIYQLIRCLDDTFQLSFLRLQQRSLAQ